MRDKRSICRVDKESIPVPFEFFATNSNDEPYTRSQPSGM